MILTILEMLFKKNRPSGGLDPMTDPVQPVAVPKIRRMPGPRITLMRTSVFLRIVAHEKRNIFFQTRMARKYLDSSRRGFLTILACFLVFFLAF